MAKLIIHVGPPKCGSSSIQQFFLKHKTPCSEDIIFKSLHSKDIAKLNQKKPEPAVIDLISDMLTKNLIADKVLIISHEYFYLCPLAIKHLCNKAKDLAADIRIIGFSRTQSGFVTSTYSQWSFRSPEKQKESTEILTDFDLETIMFSGLERSLIASILTDFSNTTKHTNVSIINWLDSYKNIMQYTSESGASVKAGILGDKTSNNSLIEDFCQLSGLTLKAEMIEQSKKALANKRFNPDLIEMIDIAVACEMATPGEHEDNDLIHSISSRMSHSSVISTEFLDHLKAYIDTYHLESNEKFCAQYGLNKDYFSPTIHISKPQIIDIIKNEDQKRLNDPTIMINKLREMSAIAALTCLEIGKEENKQPHKKAPVSMLRNVARTITGSR